MRGREKTAPAPDMGILTGTVLSLDGKSAMQMRDFTGREWTVDAAGAKLNHLSYVGDASVGERVKNLQSHVVRSARPR